MAGFKSAATKRINEINGTPGMKIWQRNYYDRIIRNENEWKRIQDYIEFNPKRWELDRENRESILALRGGYVHMGNYGNAGFIGRGFDDFGMIMVGAIPVPVRAHGRAPQQGRAPQRIVTGGLLL